MELIQHSLCLNAFQNTLSTLAHCLHTQLLTLTHRPFSFAYKHKWLSIVRWSINDNDNDDDDPDDRWWWKRGWPTAAANLSAFQCIYSQKITDKNMLKWTFNAWIHNLIQFDTYVFFCSLNKHNDTDGLTKIFSMDVVLCIIATMAST